VPFPLAGTEGNWLRGGRRIADMNWKRGLVAATVGLAALWLGWGLFVRERTERVPYETRERFDGVELRAYPRTVLVETTAPGFGAAFRRLFDYISGENEGAQSVEMTAPVATQGATVSMTAPVRTGSDGDEVTMAFYLPASYTPETAPVPTDPAVRLVVEPPRTVAVRRFSWYATEGRVERERRRLLDGLANRGLEPRGDVAVLQYDPPWTPPFLRTNEVAVDVNAGDD
jgi:hypothetical protein